MAYVDRIRPDEYQALVSAFAQVGAPIFIRVQGIIDRARQAAGNPKRIAQVTVKKAWEKGWTEQFGGAPAPAIKTLFPHMRPVSYSHDEQDPTPQPVVVERAKTLPVETAVKTDPLPVVGHKPEAPLNIVGREGGVGPRPEALTQHVTPDATRHKNDIKNLDSSSNTATSEQALTTLDPLKTALYAVEKGQVAALLNEMTILGAARANVKGLEDLAGTVIAQLLGRTDLISRLIQDLSVKDTVTLNSYLASMREVSGFVKDLQLTIKTLQESQRLLAGQPQRIEERRGGGKDSDEGDEGVPRLARLLRAPTRAPAYTGEEPQPIDVTFTETPAESETKPAESVAKESDDVAIPAETQGAATG